jgi:hypothetical protein
MISEKKMLATISERKAWLTAYAHKQMEKHELLVEGWKFEIASFYQEELRERAGLPKLIGLCVEPDKDGLWNPRIIFFPTGLRLSKWDQKQTILHEIAHAQTHYIVGDTEDHHGPTWLSQCGKIMPAVMFWREVLTYGTHEFRPKALRIDSPQCW